MLKWNNVSAGYDKEDIIQHIHLHAKKGRILILAGRNGSGKTTLLKTLLNIPYQGEIMIHQKPLTSYTPQQLAQEIAYLPQRRNPSDISVERMVLHGRFPYLNYPRRYRKIDFEKAHEAMKIVGIEQYAHKSMRELSGGMQQKAYIAMAIAQDTPIMIFDEPTVYLDIAYQISLLKLIKQLARQGKTIIIVLHDIIQALHYGDDMAIIDQGMLQAYGSVEELYEQGLITKYFGIEIKRTISEEGPQYYYLLND